MPARTTLAVCLLFFSILLAWTPDRTNASGSDNLHPPQKTPDIYVLGIVNDTVTWWKNGVAAVIPDTDTTDHTIADYLSVSGNDVYIAGTTFHGDIGVIPHSTAKYWKNGICTVLKDGTGNARAGALFVAGDDVYVAGLVGYDPFYDPPSRPHAGAPGDTINTGYSAAYWKNGVPMGLPGVVHVERGNGKIYSRHFDYVCSVYAAGKDVYVGGGSSDHKMGDPSTYHFVRYWKNGVATDLVDGIVKVDSTFNFPYLTAMAFSGKNVYAAGNEYYKGSMLAIGCRNGVWSYLPASGQFSVTSSICVTRTGDVYIAGSDVYKGSSRAVYWKNGVAMPLTDGAYNAAALSVCISGNDVYVAGYEQKDNTSYVTYWKNGVAVHLGKRGLARAIVVR